MTTWLRKNRLHLRSLLDKCGAVLFRGFDVNSPAKFDRFMTSATTSGAVQYIERSSPRRAVIAERNIFTATEYPSDREIFLHNEQSYNLRFAQIIAFCCLEAASEGGATPIADTRRILTRLSPRVINLLAEKQYLYVRNYDGVFGLPWQTVFQTDQVSVVERYCAMNRLTIKWKDGIPQTRQIRDVIARHPRTGEACWFNHLTFFHTLSMDADIRNKLHEVYSDEREFPHSTYFGDGSPIEPDIIEELRSAYLAEKVPHVWRSGDVLILDNMLTAHGRDPYSGMRRVLTAMADLITWDEVEWNPSAEGAVS